MKLTHASSYALHAVVYMAQQGTDAPIASHKIAAARGIKPRFLLKVLKPLVRENLLKSVKGPSGGYKLARPANQISVLDIIEAADDHKIRGEVSWTDNNSPGLNNKLEAICSQSAEATRKTLEKYHVSDLVGKKETEDRPARKKSRTA